MRHTHADASCFIDGCVGYYGTVLLYPYLLQAARELVLEVIREKDGDFRSGRNDFTARLGGTSLDVRHHTTNAPHTCWRWGGGVKVTTSRSDPCSHVLRRFQSLGLLSAS